MKLFAQSHAHVQRPTSLLEWHRRFAWYPVTVVTEEKLHYAWLQFVETKVGSRQIRRQK